MALNDKYIGFVYPLARYGCFSIALVYLMVGTIAILSLFQAAEDAADETRLVQLLVDLPLGEFLVWIISIGLFGWIVWRIFEAITDPYEFGDDATGIARRIGVALSSLGYGTMAYSAIEIANGNGADPEMEQQLLVARVFEWPAGRWLIVIAGIISIGAGLVQFKYVYDGAFQKRLDIDPLSSSFKKFISSLAWAGFCARGTILAVLGYFFIVAGINYDPTEVGDTDTAFDFIGGGLAGNFAFFVVALGTICYGILMIIMGYYYQFEKEVDARRKERNRS